MSAHRLTVVLSQAPGKHPAKRSLEEDITAALLMEPGVEMSIVPNLYDLGPDHTGRLFLGAVKGDLIVLSWLYPRAAFWLLDRDGVRGHLGETLLKSAADEDDDEDAEAPADRRDGDLPDRHIYCVGLRDVKKADAVVEEVRRIAAECAGREAGKPKPTQLVQLGLTPPTPKTNLEAFTPEQMLAPAGRRWYPVIDYSRCTNCMECLDFCLFGVYGTDKLENILVENQDNCKRGCPACSRVCPEQAIIFPEYKTPAIAGAAGGQVSGLKIDLTKLFGGGDVDPLQQAVAERDRELVADGRDAVGASVGLPKRQAHKADGPKDDLDSLIDDLDALEL